MTTETTFIPLETPDISTIDPALVGVDPDITTESIRASAQPLSFDSGSLTIEANATIGDLSLISLLSNPNLGNQLVLPQLAVGGTMMANDIILGSGLTKLISDNTGTYIYNDLSVSGVINNTDLNNKINNKSNRIIQAPATITVGQPADFTYFVDANSNSYPLFSSSDIVWSKTDNNISLNISNEFKSNYATTENLINNYATQLELLEKVDYTYFDQQLDIVRLNTIANANAFTDDKLTHYITTFTPLSNTYLSIIDAVATYQPINSMSDYITIGTTLLSNYNTKTTTNSILSNYITSDLLTKANVGLGNVDNTSASGLPISIATQNALNLKSNINSPVFTAPLEVQGFIPNTQLRIIPGSDNGESSISFWRTANKTNLANGDVWIMGQNTYGVDGGNFAFGTVAGSVYTINKDTRIINVNTNVHVQGNSVVTSNTLNSYLTTATASSTYAPINNPTFTGTVSGINKAMVGLGNVDNTSDVNKPVSTATQTALDLKANLASPNFSGTLTIDNVAVARMPWLLARIRGSSVANADLVVVSQSGQTSIGTAKRINTGVYEITFATTAPNANYAIFVTIRSVSGFFNGSYGTPSTTAFRVFTYNATGAQTDVPDTHDFSIAVYL